MNRVTLVGNLTRDPELKQTNTGTAVCRFAVACNRRYKNAEGKYDADFVNCVAWKQTAEFISQWFSKGRPIGIDGHLQSRSYDDKNGERRYVTEVVVDSAEFVGARESQGRRQNGSLDGYTENTPKPEAAYTDADVFAGDIDLTYEPLSAEKLPF